MLSLISLLLPAFAAALPTPQTDGNGVPAGGVGYDPNASGTTNQNAPGATHDGGNAGASGSDSGGANISTGAIAGIAAGAGVVVVVCITLMVLWYMSQKRQWNLRAKVRAKASQVFTPKLKNVFSPRDKTTFSPIEKRRAGSSGQNLIGGSRSPSPPAKDARTSSRTRDETLGHSPPRQGRDAEKVANGLAVRELTPAHSHSRNASTQSETGQATKKVRPMPPTLTVPQSKFDMDSPKTPLWQKVFGR